MRSIVTELSLFRGDDSPLFGESATKLALDDDGAGLFLTISQDPNEFGPGGILRFDFDEIEEFFEAVRFLKTQAKKAENAPI